VPSEIFPFFQMIPGSSIVIGWLTSVFLATAPSADDYISRLRLTLLNLLAIIQPQQLLYPLTKITSSELHQTILYIPGDYFINRNHANLRQDP
jgi:hypothetical protein